MKFLSSAGLVAILCSAGHAFGPNHRHSYHQQILPGKSVPRLHQQNVFLVSWNIKRAPALAASASYSPSLTPENPQPSPQGTIQDLLFFTNQERHRNGLNELFYNKELEKAAQRHASDMAEQNYFSHDGLDGSDLKARVGNTNYRYTNVGENLFWRTPDNDPAYAVQGWMESAGHRKNVMDPQFTEIGLGYAFDSANSKHYYVQVFGRPVDAPTPPPPTSSNGVSSPPISSVQTPQETREIMIRVTNDARREQGLPALSMSSELSHGAQEHADDMMRQGELSQKLKRGSYDRFFTNIGARFAARESFNDAEGAVRGWIDKSPSSDILSERFTETGLGYATDGKQHYYVQLFGTPMETGVGRQDFVGSGTPPIGVNGPGMRVPRKEKREDKSRNGDFGRMGFGQSNRERREEVDEVDDAWSDDRKVIQQFQNRPRPGPRRVRDMRGRDPMQDSRGMESMQSNRGSFNIRDSNPVQQMGPRPGPTAASTMGSNNNGVSAPTVGFNDNWNKDYSGTANTGGFNQHRKPRGPSGGGGQISSMQEEMNPYEQFNRLQNENFRGPTAGGGYTDGPFGYDAFDPQMVNNGGPMNNGPGGFNQFNQPGMNMNDNMRFSNLYSVQQAMQQQGMNNGQQRSGNQFQQQQGMNNGQNGFNQFQQQGNQYQQQGSSNGQGMQDGRGGYNQYSRQQSGMDNNGYQYNSGYANNNGGARSSQRMASNGRQLRRNTASAFGKPPPRNSGGSNGSVSDLHYLRFQNQIMQTNMMYGGGGGMNYGFQGPMDYGMGYGGYGGPGMMGPQQNGYGQWGNYAMGRRP